VSFASINVAKPVLMQSYMKLAKAMVVPGAGTIIQELVSTLKCPSMNSISLVRPSDHLIPIKSSALNAVYYDAHAIAEVWKDWTWTTNYPDHHELRAYFDHANKVLNLEKDTAFESVVVDAQFNVDEGKWHVKTADGRTARSKFLIVAAGFAAKR
jgi:hypothetical protein